LYLDCAVHFFLFLLGVADLELPEVLDSVFLQSVRQVAAIFVVKVFNPDLFFVKFWSCSRAGRDLVPARL
jgi:hypothetical protein